MKPTALRTLPLFAGFFLSTAQLTPFAPSPATDDQDLRPRYGTITRILRGKHHDLEFRFVVGEADPKFVAVDPNLWDVSGKPEVFSQKASFGRMLCPGHFRNAGKKYLISVRA